MSSDEPKIFLQFGRYFRLIACAHVMRFMSGSGAGVYSQMDMCSPITLFAQTVHQLYMSTFELTPVRRSHFNHMRSNGRTNSNSRVTLTLFGLFDQSHGALIKRSKDGKVDTIWSYALIIRCLAIDV